MDNIPKEVTKTLWRERVVTKRDVILLLNFLLLLVSVSLLLTCLTPKPTAVTISYMDPLLNFWKSDVFSAYTYVHSIIKTDLGTFTFTMPPYYKDFAKYGVDNMVFIAPCIFCLLMSLPLSFMLLVSRKNEGELNVGQLTSVLVFNLPTFPLMSAYFAKVGPAYVVCANTWSVTNAECKPGSMWVILKLASVLNLISTTIVILLLVDLCRRRRARGRPNCCDSSCGQGTLLSLDSSIAHSQFSSSLTDLGRTGYMPLVETSASLVTSTPDVVTPESFIQYILFREKIHFLVLFLLRLICVILAFSTNFTHVYSAYMEPMAGGTLDDDNSYTYIRKDYYLDRSCSTYTCANHVCISFEGDSVMTDLGRAPLDTNSTLQPVLFVLPLMSLILTVPIIVGLLPCCKIPQKAIQVLLGLAIPFDFLTIAISCLQFAVLYIPFFDTLNDTTWRIGPLGSLWGGDMGAGMAFLLAVPVLSAFCFVFGIGLCDQSIQTIGCCGTNRLQTPMFNLQQTNIQYAAQSLPQYAAQYVPPPAPKDPHIPYVAPQIRSPEVLPAPVRAPNSVNVPPMGAYDGIASLL